MFGMSGLSCFWAPEVCKHLSGGRYVVDWKAKSNAVQELVFKKFEIFYLTIRVSCDFIHRIGSGLLALPGEGMMGLRTVFLILGGGGQRWLPPSFVILL